LFIRILLRVLALPIAIIALAVSVRSYRLGTPYITTDESFSWRLTQYPPWEMIERLGRDGHAPLHFFLLDGWTAAWGDSTAAMRSLSVLVGLASVVMVYWLVFEALEHHLIRPADGHPESTVAAAPGEKPLSRLCGPAALAALVAAVHPLQVIAGRTARMYSLGVLLAALSAWLLLRAIRAGRPWGWWTAYGVTAAAFCYTHYFAFFTLFAQAIYVVGVAAFSLCRGGDPRRREQALTAGGGLLLAGALALALFSPWLPVFRVQAAEVLEDFWIPRQTALETTLTLTAWATGMDRVVASAVPVLLFLLAVAVFLAVWRGGRAGWFFLLQAVVPWACCLAVSILGHRPLLQVRYLAFAQVGLFGLWGVLAASLPTRTERIALAGLIVAPALVGLSGAGHLYPVGEHAAVAAMRFLREHHQDGDMILVPGPAAVNQTRHTARQVGLERADVRCRWSAFDGPGFTVHISSLRSSELVRAEEERPWTEIAPRIWLMTSEDAAFTGASHFVANRTIQRTFEGSEDSRVTLALYVREEGTTAE